jgi:glycosyltransferase involved in cell wall biosynthesis
MINSPKVFIAVPVYNNIKHIEDVLLSIVSQSYKNLQIHIFDNSSTDGTSRICKAFSEKYSHVNYIKNKSNLRSAENFRIAISSITFPFFDYFIFARGDALLSKNVIKKMVDIMENDQKASLVFPKLKWVDDDWNEILDKKMGFYDTSGYNLGSRLSFLLLTKPNQIYGLMRVEMLDSFDDKKWWQMIGMDHLFLFELALLGHFRHLDSEDWMRIYKYDNEPIKNRFERYRDSLLLESTFIDRHFPLLKIVYSLLRAVTESKLTFSNKLKCFFVVILLSLARAITSKNEPI